MEGSPLETLRFYREFLGKARENTFSKEDLHSALSNLKHQLTILREYLETTIRDNLLDEPAGLMDAFSKFSDASSWVQRATETGNQSEMKQGLAELEIVLDLLCEGSDKVGLDKAAAGPSQDRILNLLINAKSAVQQGTLSEDGFGFILADFGEYFEKCERNFRRFLKSGELFPELQSSLQARVPAHRQAKLALKAVHQAWEEKSYSRMDSPLAQLEEFMNAYADFCEEIGMLSEIETLENTEDSHGKRCFKCGKPSPVEALACKSCGLLFPQFETPKVSHFEIKEGASMKGSPGPSPNVEKLLFAVEDLQDGEITADEFASVLDWMRGKLDGDSEEIASLGATKSSKQVEAQLKEISKKYFDGITEMEAGLSALRVWSRSQQEPERAEGVKLCVAGAEKVALAKSMADVVSGKFSAETALPDEHIGGIA